MALTLLSLSLGISAAAPMTFFGEDTGLGEGTPLTSHPNADEARDNFLAHLVNPGVEDLESFSHGTSAPLSVNFGVAGTATLQGTGSVYEGATNVGRYPISGSKYWEASSDFYLEFTDPQVAFGFYGIDVGDYNGQLTITYEDGTSETLTVPHKTNTMGGTVIYFGFIDVDHPFVKVTFGNTASGTDYFGFDDFTIGTIGQVIIEDPTNIPEFPTVALPMIAIIGLALFFQRRKE
ncbi:PEF-CTERM sorting domain-containing protein [Methanolobus sp.]|uniref:PEF-CTERM sorting domain-containing protein n=1 Tax=Methanolobus sp. TaxID=1874737 RepID=UPI0025DEA428|nr:PEF-CTERM sorting domain-containing protein [Methanolobus sp.]